MWFRRNTDELRGGPIDSSSPDADRGGDGVRRRRRFRTARSGPFLRARVGLVRLLNEIGVQNGLWNQLTWSSTDSRRPRWQGRQRDIRVRRDDVGVVMQPTFFSVPPRLRSKVR